MGRKSRAAKASVVAAFVAAGGTVGSALPAAAAPAAPAVSSTQVQWGDALVRFLKLDGFPTYLKDDQFALYYKNLQANIAELSDLYLKDGQAVDDLLALYYKANNGPLAGVLIGLEQFYKNDELTTLTDYLKSSTDALDAYFKFQTFFTALRRDAPSVFDFFYKETGIAGNPLNVD